MRSDIFAMGSVLATLLAWCSSAFALNPELDISQYAHMSWKIRDGFSKSVVTSIAQSPDGYLWLGTELGMLRFDGVRPVAWEPPPGQQLPSTNIRTLLTTRDGSLWIATDGGLARWKDGRLTHDKTLAGRYVSTLVEDREGSLWATSYFNLHRSLCVVRNNNSSAECYGDDGGPGAGAIGVYEDRKDNLWVGTLGPSAGVWRWRPGPPRFYPLSAPPNGIRGLLEDDDGVPLVSQTGGIARLRDGRTEMAYPLPPSRKLFDFPLLRRDRDGGLWLGSSNGGGLVHVHHGITDVFASSDGLSDDKIWALFEDREGSIWVSTSEGLDRFRDLAVITYSVKQGFSSGNVQSVLAARDGSIWAGATRLNQWSHGRVSVYGPPGSDGVAAIFQDTLGRVWISTRRDVGYIENGRMVALKGVGGGLIRAIVEDGDANLWVANRDRGLFRVAIRTGDIELIPWARLNQNSPPLSVAADRSLPGVWLGFEKGAIVHFAGGEVRASYGTADGLSKNVRGLQLERDGTLWAATSGGLSRVKNGRVATLTTRNGLPCDGVEWLVADDDRALWLGAGCGLVRIPRADIAAWATAADTDHEDALTIHTALFDSADGVRLFVGGAYFSQPAVKASDGRLWFGSQGGLSVVDPRRLPVNPLPPPVHIERITADRATYDPASTGAERLRLPALIRDLQIDYTALSLVAPEKMRFRYKLEGFDADWQDVGTRRQAFYTNLAPRDYRFRVIASNNSGVWNESGASLAFSVAPAYYQTAWFPVLSAAVVLALVWTAHRVRLRIVEKHEHEISALNERLMKAQEQERIRIAGELHDGVMQEMLAATMMVGSAKRRVTTNPADAAATMDKVQQKLVQVGGDIRQLSHDLHPPALQAAGLPGAMRTYCEEFSASSGMSVACNADDSARDLSRGAALALFRIVQEALGNAAKHAAAKHIIVRLTRADGHVSLTVSDDGVGFDRSRLGTSGGLGLIMMRERASQLNGKFEFESAPGRGTTITVMIPFR